MVIGSDPSHITHCIQSLSSHFAPKDLGDLRFFLGIEVTTNSTGLSLSQTKYLSELLKHVNMLNSKPCPSPMASGTTLSQDGSHPCTDPHLYRSVVGALQYATLTQPDIIFSVNKASQFMHQPIETHWAVVKRILRYISGTLDYGIQLYKNSSPQIHAYSDADWVKSIDDRRSTSGYCIYLGRNIIS